MTRMTLKLFLLGAVAAAVPFATAQSSSTDKPGLQIVERICSTVMSWTRRSGLGTRGPSGGRSWMRW